MGRERPRSRTEVQAAHVAPSDYHARADGVLLPDLAPGAHVGRHLVDQPRGTRAGRPRSSRCRRQLTSEGGPRYSAAMTSRMALCSQHRSSRRHLQSRRQLALQVRQDGARAPVGRRVVVVGAALVSFQVAACSAHDLQCSRWNGWRLCFRVFSVRRGRSPTCRKQERREH